MTPNSPLGLQQAAAQEVEQGDGGELAHEDAVAGEVDLGTSAGGSLAEHLHVHVVPRWGGDANFITIVGGSKVIPQLLRDTRQLLATEWAKQS